MENKYLAIRRQADLIPMKDILNHFHIKHDSNFSFLLNCPFPHHSHDSTPSFKIYENTNSFYCFGCKAAGGTSFFVKNMLDVSLNKALDYCAVNFNLKSYSLAKSFHSWAKKIDNKELEIDRNLIVTEAEHNISAIGRKVLALKVDACYTNLLMLEISNFYEQFDCLSNDFINKLISKESFECDCKTISNNLLITYKTWFLKAYVKDAENPLEELTPF